MTKEVKQYSVPLLKLLHTCLLRIFHKWFFFSSSFLFDCFLRSFFRLWWVYVVWWKVLTFYSEINAYVCVCAHSLRFWCFLLGVAWRERWYDRNIRKSSKENKSLKIHSQHVEMTSVDESNSVVHFICFRVCHFAALMKINLWRWPTSYSSTGVTDF